MFLKDLFFPKFCLSCGLGGVYICLNCQKKLSYLEKDRCFYCDKPSLFGLTHPRCRRPHGIDGAISVFHYNNFLKTIIKNIKYRLATEVWKELIMLIKPKVIEKLSFYKKQNQYFFIQPIPLHPDKLKERGFNQANFVADFFNQFLSLPRRDFLIRRKYTASQAQIKGGRERYLNILGAFDILAKDEIRDKNIIIIDDVITTGATLREAARVFKYYGAKKVFALTLAKG